MEIWDAYDENFQLVEGKKLVRGEPVPAGLYHLVTDILVRHTDGTYLLMRRDLRKTYGGCWQATAGGSALAGETPLEGARRELFEETGIRCDDLKEIGRERYGNAFYVEYLCVTDRDKEDIVLQEGETIAFRWVTAETLLSIRSLVGKRIFKYYTF